MSHTSRQVNPGKLYNAELKLAILQHGGVIEREEALWLHASWETEEDARRFEESRAHPVQRREEKRAS
jgi:hypothetical protein